ncbi:terpene synthase family protein (plasmid) [Streptomyces murinus]|uniref:terpene synthase family protein n=1 Tax=Streptomyces murinus TaxID=33900 RepID=UPI000A1EB594|nr:terpene synthase family protein [Streptomyces murinus]WDO11217.1 terpene synthase family protein [Streptomyces murinus]
MRVEIPPLYVPFECTLNPGGPALEKKTLAWMAAHGLTLDAQQQAVLKNYNLTEGHCLTYPYVPGPMTQLMHDWDIVGCVFDALVLETPPVSQDLGLATEVIVKLLKKMEGPAGPEPEDHPIVRLLADIAHQVGDLAGPMAQRHWNEAQRKHWLAHLHQRGLALARRQPSIDHYAYLRQLTVCGDGVFQGVALIRGFDLPAAQAANPHVRALTEAASLLLGWDNDLYSYGMDYAGTTPSQPTDPYSEINLIHVVQHAHGCSLAEALQHAVGLRNQAMGLFVRLGEALPPDTDPAIRTYVSDLGIFVCASIDLHRSPSTHRYRTAAHTTPEGATIRVSHASTITSTPPPGTFDPLTLESTRWWYDLLDESL